MNPSDRYGLTGLLGVIRLADPDLNTLAVGTDLTTLGLNLTSAENLCSTFAYPCLDTPARHKPDHVLPYCYYMFPPPLKTSHFPKFQLETLFYIFYNMPKDMLQVFAARELCLRDWRYQKELKLWFSRPNEQVLQKMGFDQEAAAQAIQSNSTYIYFDVSTWERRLYRENGSSAPLKFTPLEELEI